jgi:hypothetical protein
MKAVKIIIGFIFSLILSLLILDQFINYAQIEGTSSTDFDTDIGRKRRANLNFTFFNEGFSMGYFNKYSYLGPSYPIQKIKDNVRIAILGDSYVESFQVFRRDQFHQLLEENLYNSLNKPVEVLNFGRSGFDLADMYAYNDRMVKKFHPDITVYMISDADLSCSQTDPLIPKVIEKNSQLIVTNELMPKSYLDTYKRTKVLTQNSSLMAMFNNSRKLVKAGKFWPKMLDKFYWKPQNIKPTEHIIQSHEIPNLAYKIIDHLPPNTIIVNRGSNNLDSLFMLRILEKQIPYIDLRDTLSVVAEKGIDPHYWPVTKTRGHWNHQAHQAVGLYLSNEIERIIKEYPNYQYNYTESIRKKENSIN